jgi:hypothetical protein
MSRKAAAGGAPRSYGDTPAAGAGWWAQLDLNQQPEDYESSALTG